MRILVLGGDGYTGWPLAMSFAADGHDVTVVDDYSKRTLARKYKRGPLQDCPTMEIRSALFERATGAKIDWHVLDILHYDSLCDLLIKVTPEVIVHLAEMPSAPFSMLGYVEAFHTLNNNLNGTLALAHAVINFAPDAHVIKLGTMGEYGTPNVPINEGWLDVRKAWRHHRFLYPSEPGSLYHVTKVQDTHMLWLYTKIHSLRVTDVMQGPVYGVTTNETTLGTKLGTSFFYDDVFGTVINRFVAEAVSELPLTVYGAGCQKRGYLHLQDCVDCIKLLAQNPPIPGEFRIVNQLASFHSVRELAELVRSAGVKMGLNVSVAHLDNPRVEQEEHFYEVESNTLGELGFRSEGLSEARLVEFLQFLAPLVDHVDQGKILPRHSWR